MDKQDWRSIVGQLIVAGFKGNKVTDEVKKLIHDYRVGNFILFGRNIGTGEEILELTASLQEEARKAGQEKPLLICTDQENGVVQRLKAPATSFPGAMALGAVGDSQTAYQVGKATGLELKEVGINWNLAPVVDVNNNLENPVIHVRSFGETPEAVQDLAIAWMKGCQDAGVATTLKHFPGHGDTNIDSHSDLPVIHHSLDRLFEVELVPFIEGIKQGADTIMTAHIYFSNLAERPHWPATLSRNILTGLLREQLGFDGVITTDCLEMNAIAKTVGVARGAVEAIKAGADLAMISHTYEYQVEALDALLEIVQNGEVAFEQIEHSVRRIGHLKDRYARDNSIKPYTGSFEYFGSPEHRQLAEKTYRESVTIVNKSHAQLNLPLKTDSKILAVYPGMKKHLQVEERIYQTKIGEALLAYSSNIDHFKIDGSEMDATNVIQRLTAIAEKYDGVLLFTLSLQNDRYSQVIRSLARHPKAIVVSLRGPFSLRFFDNLNHAVCVYDDHSPAIHAVLDVVFGKYQASGQLPVTMK